jgi:CHAT domain-containing protein
MGGMRRSIAEYAGGAAAPSTTERSRGWAGSEGWSLAIILCGILLSPCAPVVATPLPQPVLARTCRSIDTSHELALQLAAPADGMLRVEVVERGISTVSVLNDTPSTPAASPIDRFGTVVLTADVRRGARRAVKVHVDDSRDVGGEVCVSADLIAPSDRARMRAESDFAAAGRAIGASDWNTAFGRYLRAAREFEALHLSRLAAMARHAMAELAYLRFDRKRDAYALADDALASYGDAAQPALRGELAELIAKALIDMPGSNPEAAAPAVRHWLGIARRYELADPYGARELPRIDILSGYLEYLLNEFEPSRPFFARAAASCRDLRDWDCYAVASQNLAELAEQGKDYSLALSAYADALRRLPPELDPKLAADIWNNLGRLQGIVGLFSASERSHAAAMQAYARLGDCPGLRRSLVRVGNLLVHIGNLADAESDLARAASLDCPSLLASATSTAGQSKTEPAPALESARRDARDPGRVVVESPCARPLDPAPLAPETKTIVFSSVLSLGNAAMLTGDTAEVWRCLDAARFYTPNSRNQVRLADARGAAFLERGDAKNAQLDYTDALRIANEAGLPATYEYRRNAQIGLVKAMQLAGKAPESLDGAYKALAVSTASGDIENTITSLRLIAAGYRASGKLADAVHVLQVATDLIEAVPIDELNGEQRATFLATQHTVFAELTDIFASEQGASTSTAWLAFEASERGRARSLRYALNQETRNAASPLRAPPAANYQRLLGEVVEVTARANTSPAHDTLIDAIDRVALGDRSASSFFDRAQLGRTLKELNATLVEYASASTEMLAFVIDGENARVVHLGDSQAIARATTELRDRLRDTETPPSEVQAAAETLARLIWWPVVPYLQGGRIAVVPDDALHTVPLAVLPWSKDPAQAMVVQHAESVVIPSALFLVNVHSRASTHSEAPRVALIGDPVFRVADWRRECIDTHTASSSTGPVKRDLSAWTESLPRLPGTRLEINAIARLARESRPASRIETLVGCAAVPTAVRKVADANVDLLHIATHARIDAQRPRLSALALTPEVPADAPASTFGLLDILSLKLNSKLVVLSACDTSRGRLLPGEGVLGPAQAFLQAGSAAVLASYWKVDDQITSTFMQRFYKYLLVDRLSASAALRKTQLESAASGKTYEWAAFSLYGWPDSSI